MTHIDKIKHIKNTLDKINELKNNTYIIKKLVGDDDFSNTTYQTINEPFKIKTGIKPTNWEKTIVYKIVSDKEIPLRPYIFDNFKSEDLKIDLKFLKKVPVNLSRLNMILCKSIHDYYQKKPDYSPYNILQAIEKICQNDTIMTIISTNTFSRKNYSIDLVFYYFKYIQLIS